MNYDKFLPLANKMFDNLSHTALKGYDVAVTLAFYDALSGIVTGILFLAGLLILVFVLWPRWVKHYQTCEEFEISGPIAFGWCISQGGLTTTCIIGVVINLFNVWNYIGLIHPELYLAHEVYLKVMGG